MQSDNERNIAIVRDLVEAMDAGNPAVLDFLCTPDFAAHFNGIELSLAQVREAAAGFVAAFADLKHSIRSIEGAGDRVTLRALDTGLKKGEILIGCV
jgi:ketosteroid isomerase-like protein